MIENTQKDARGFYANAMSLYERDLSILDFDILGVLETVPGGYQVGSQPAFGLMLFLYIQIRWWSVITSSVRAHGLLSSVLRVTSLPFPCSPQFLYSLCLRLRTACFYSESSITWAMRKAKQLVPYLSPCPVPFSPWLPTSSWALFFPGSCHLN